MTDETKQQNYGPHSALAVVNYFITAAAKEGKSLTLLKLIQLVYLAHGWCLGFTGKPLISSQVEAWQHGPIVPEVYDEFDNQPKRSRLSPPTRNGELISADMADEQIEIMDMVYRAYSPLSARALSRKTHASGTPWDQTTDYYAPIPNGIIRKYYEAKAQAQQ